MLLFRLFKNFRNNQFYCDASSILGLTEWLVEVNKEFS